ncbi:MAG: hypothetical protein ACRDJB_01375 [Actinomycetota bacterium]
MDPEELVQTNGKLRAFAAEHGMQWVLAEVDEAVALGVVETRELRRSSRSGRTVYEDVTGSTSARGRRRPEEFVRSRPMTDLEQVQLLVAALRRVLVDVDTVAAASIATLNDSELRQQTASPAAGGVEPWQLTSPQAGPGEYSETTPPLISQIDFEPDEGSTSPSTTTEALRHGDRRHHVADVLDQVAREIGS